MGTTEPWAFGYQRFGNDKLPDHLLAIAKHRANRAIGGINYDGRITLHDDRSAIEWLDRAIDAGTSIEIFCKYILSKFSPALLIKPSSPPGIDVLLHLTDNGQFANSSGAMELFSRDASDCVDIVQQLSNRIDGVPSLDGTTVRDAKNVLKVRNLAIHLGMVERAVLIGSLMQFISAMVEILKVAQLDSNDFWDSDPSQTLVNIANNRPLSSRVDSKISAAHEFIKGKPLPSPDVSAEALRGAKPIPEVIIKAAPAPSVQYDHQKIVPCPECKQAAILWGIESVGGVTEIPVDINDIPAEELESMTEGEAENLTTFVKPVHAVPQEMACSFCRLHIARDEIAEVGLVEHEIRADWFIGYQDPSFREVEHYEEWKGGFL